MKFLQTLVLKLLCLALLALGVLLVLYNSSYLYDVATSYIDGSSIRNDLARVIVGVLIVLVALFGLLPIRKRRGKSITFPDEQGETTIRLGPIERTLGKEVSRRREVKKLNLHFEPADDKRRVLVEAKAVIRKSPDTATRDVYRTMKAIILQEARNMLGTDTVIGVNLDIEGIVPVKGKRSKQAVEEAPLVLAESPSTSGEETEESRSPFDQTAPEETGQVDAFESGYRPPEADEPERGSGYTEPGEEENEERPQYSYLPDEPSEAPGITSTRDDEGAAPPMIELDEDARDRDEERRG